MQEINNKPTNTNKLIILLISIILAGSFIFILLRTLNSQRATAESMDDSLQKSPLQILDTPTALPTAHPTRILTEPAQQISDDDILARVNDEIISTSYFQLAVASDQALQQLLGQESKPTAQMLDRLINEELVRQDAQYSAYSVSKQEVEESLESFLSQNGKIIQDLELSLLENGITPDTFRDYYSQLYLVDQFSRQQAQALNLSIPKYIQKLQSEARISFGPSANPASSNTVLEQEIPIATTTIKAASTGSEPATSEPEVDDPQKSANGFDLPAVNTLNVDRISLEDLHGKPILLSFFATWCSYCKNQAPVLVQAHEEYGEQIQLIGIVVNENQKQVQEYIKSMGIKYPVLLDNNSQTATAYKVSGFPTTFFLDAEGNIVASHVGQLSQDKIYEYLSKFELPPP